MTAAIAGALIGAAAWATPVSAAERGFAVPSFDRVRAAGPFDVIVRAGGPALIRATGPQAALDRLIVTAEDGVLSIRPDQRDQAMWRNWLRKGEKVVVTVRTPSLRGVALAGSGTVTVDRAQADRFAASVAGSGDLSIGALRADEAVLSVAGSGDITVAGRAARVSATILGSGDIRAEGLATATASASVAGSGDVRLTASGTVAASIAGSGDVHCG